MHKRNATDVWADVINGLSKLFRSGSAVPDGLTLPLLAEKIMGAIDFMQTHDCGDGDCTGVRAARTFLIGVGSEAIDIGIIGLADTMRSDPKDVDLEAPSILRAYTATNLSDDAAALLDTHVDWDSSTGERMGFWRDVVKVYDLPIPDADERPEYAATRDELVDLYWFYLQCLSDLKFAAKRNINPITAAERIAATVHVAQKAGLASEATNLPTGLVFSEDELSAIKRAELEIEARMALYGPRATPMAQA